MQETAYAKINLALHVRERRPDGYWVKFDGRWIAAPDRTIVHANPLGVAVVWVWRRGEATVVRCFAPASES